MTPSRILAVIAETRSLRARFHNLPIEERKVVIGRLAGSGDEKRIEAEIRRVRRERRKADAEAM